MLLLQPSLAVVEVIMDHFQGHEGDHEDSQAGDPAGMMCQLCVCNARIWLRAVCVTGQDRCGMVVHVCAWVCVGDGAPLKERSERTMGSVRRREPCYQGQVK